MLSLHRYGIYYSIIFVYRSYCSREQNREISKVNNRIIFPQIDTEVPPGVVYTLEQAQGYCDGSSVKTELFKTERKFRDGRTEVKFHRGFIED